MTISGADPNIPRSAPPHEEQFLFPEAQGGAALRAQLNISNQSAIDQAIEGHPLGGKGYGREETKAAPQLTPPIWKFRMALAEEENKEDPAVEERAQGLLSQFPPEMARDAAFADFVKLFALAEKALEKAAAPFDPASVAATNSASAHETIQEAIFATLSQGNTIVHGGKAFLEEVGAGYEGFDLMLRALNEAGVLLGKLEAFASLYENGLLTGDEKTKVQDLLRQITLLTTSIEGARGTKELQILKPLMKELALTGQLLLTEQGMQLATLTEAMTLQGKESAATLFGPNLSKLLNGFGQESDLFIIGMTGLLTGGAAFLKLTPGEEKRGN